MRSVVATSLPRPARESIARLGHDIRVERKEQALSITVMARRMGVSTSTYQRIEKGDPSVTVAMYAMALACLGRDDELATMLDPPKGLPGLPRRRKQKSKFAVNPRRLSNS